MSHHRTTGVSRRTVTKAATAVGLTALLGAGTATAHAVTRLGPARVIEPDLVGQEGDVLSLMVDVGAIDALQARLSGQDDSLH